MKILAVSNYIIVSKLLVLIIFYTIGKIEYDLGTVKSQDRILLVVVMGGITVGQTLHKFFPIIIILLLLHSNLDHKSKGQVLE